MSTRRWIRFAIGCALVAWAGASSAQDDPFADDPDIGGPVEEESPSEDANAPADAPADEPAAEPVAEPEPEPAPEPEPETSGGVSLQVSADASASSEGAALDTDAQVDAPGAAKPENKDAPRVITGSHIRRLRLEVDGALIIDSPLTTTVEGRDYLQMRRQLSGAVAPDTTTALGLGAPGTGPSYSTGMGQLRMQPTLVLLNGRRLVSAPFSGPYGSDFVDMNQLPITLIERVETTRGNVAGLYGDGAVGGVVNFITHRDYDGVEVDVGGQVTDKFDQHEEDVTLTLGAGSEKTGMNVMVSYFTRQPLGASDRTWIGERSERTETLLNNPGSFQQLAGNFEYPFPDPYCDIAQGAGQSTGLEVRIQRFGPPETFSLLPPALQEEFLQDNDVARSAMFGMTPNGVLDPYETSTYCAGNYAPMLDLTLKDQRLQTYGTFWHALSDHTEGFGEAGYYRSENENHTAPSLPLGRLIAPLSDPTFAGFPQAVWVPENHADQPVWAPGLARAEVPAGRIADNQFIVGRVTGNYAGPALNQRRVDTMRGVLGLRGDLEAAGKGSVLESWDWDLAGVYTESQAVSRVPDTLLDELARALNSCTGTTIKERQEAGCFNPFYSSALNSVALDPLNLSNASVENDRGFIASDSETMSGDTGFGFQDGGYICDPAVDPSACPDALDPNGDSDGDGMLEYESAGTPNTQQVIDRITGEHISQERRSLATIDAALRGDAVRFSGGGLAFGLGGQFRRETLRIDYDAAYNQRLYAFVYGAPDVPSVGRNVGAGFAEMRLRVLDGLIEVQPAARVEYFDDVGTAINGMGALAIRPFASMTSPPEALEWLVIRGHVGRGHRAPSLLQLHGAYTEFASVQYFERTPFVPHQIQGNDDLDFEKYTTVSGGLQWDWAGIHVGADFWMSFIDDLIAGDNTQTLAADCEQQSATSGAPLCTEVVVYPSTRFIDHIESRFDNLAEVETNGLDGGVSYTLDTKRRNLGDFGVFVLGVQGTFLNQYLIKSPRALREYYRAGGATPVFNADGTRDYSGLSAEYDAAGFRNLENFAPPMPKLRFAVPLRWMFEGHAVGVTMRYIGEYNDDSEQTIEKYGLVSASEQAAGLTLTDLALLEGETIPAWVVFDASYGFSFGDEGWRTKLTIGMINILDEPPPEAESPLGYDVGVHDPRGRMVYLRATGEF